MFEQTGMGPAAGQHDAASILPATAEDFPGEASVPTGPTGPAVVWREATPGPELIAQLAAVSLQACTDSELLDVLAGWQRVEAWVSAQQTRALDRTRTRLLETAVREETDV